MKHKHAPYDEDFDGPDDLDLFVEECTCRNPDFPRLLAEAEEIRRQVLPR